MFNLSHTKTTQRFSDHAYRSEAASTQARSRLIKALSLVAFILATTQAPKAFSQEEAALPSIEEIERAWKARELSIETLDCKWSARLFIPAESHSAQEFPSRKSVLVPKEDLKLTQQCLLQMGTGGRYRYERDGKELVNRIQQYTDRHTIFVTDGKQAKSLYGADETGEHRYAPLGFIRKNEQIFEFLDLATSGAIILYCRPKAPGAERYCSLKGGRIIGRAIANGRRCVLVEHGEAARKTQLYFDLEWDLVPVRLIGWSFDSEAGESFESFRFDLGYRESSKGPPHLTTWKLKSFGSANKPIHYQHAVVEHFEINTDIPDSAFNLEFPAGTKAVNQASRETYIIREDGSKRPITLAEREALVPYKILLNTEPRETIPKESNPP